MAGISHYTICCTIEVAVFMNMTTRETGG